ncbi:MAG TPA: hypothetical protein VJR29_02770 [bacterium]|nr:hypothetical protein [bacterium]
MKILSAFVAIFLLGITAALAGTGKQSYSLPGELPAGSSVWLSEYVEAVGAGAAIASTFRVPPSNPANFYAGITHVNSDGTLNTTMAPDGVLIHPNKTNMYGFDSAFDKLALAGTWGPNGNPSYMQTFSALEPEFDSPAIGLGGTLRFAAVRRVLCWPRPLHSSVILL